MSMNLLEPVLSKVSSLVAWSWHVMCKILRRRHTNRNCGKRSTSCTGFEHSDFVVNCSSVEINVVICELRLQKSQNRLDPLKKKHDRNMLYMKDIKTRFE